MEFEEMKRIWDSQNEEPLYAINEATLYRRIQEKGSSISYWLSLNEWILIGCNPVCRGYCCWSMPSWKVAPGTRSSAPSLFYPSLSTST